MVSRNLHITGNCVTGLKHATSHLIWSLFLWDRRGWMEMRSHMTQSCEMDYSTWCAPQPGNMFLTATHFPSLLCWSLKWNAVCFSREGTGQSQLRRNAPAAACSYKVISITLLSPKSFLFVAYFLFLQAFLWDIFSFPPVWINQFAFSCVLCQLWHYCWPEEGRGSLRQPTPQVSFFFFSILLSYFV